MLNLQDYENFFDQFVKADKTPFTIKSKVVFKEGGELKSYYEEETINLSESSNIIVDLIINCESTDFNLYPKTFFQKIFKKRTQKSLKTLINTYKEDNFVLCSSNTKKKLKEIDIEAESDNQIIIDNILIIGKRTRLVWMEESNKTFTNIDYTKFKILHLR